MGSDGSKGAARRSPLAMVLAVMVVLVMTAAVLVPARPAEAATGWGSPYWCTHSSSTSCGIYGCRTVMFKSAYWKAPGWHVHRVTVAYNYTGTETPTYYQKRTVDCAK